MGTEPGEDMSRGIHLSVDTMNVAAKAAMPEGLFVQVSEELEAPHRIHIMVHTSVYAQSNIDPNMLYAADHPAAIFANHVEMCVEHLRTELEKVLGAINERER